MSDSTVYFCYHSHNLHKNIVCGCGLILDNMNNSYSTDLHFFYCFPVTNSCMPSTATFEQVNVSGMQNAHACATLFQSDDSDSLLHGALRCP
jgi:hypothetical protein